tara:strand:+ start:551 stop:988 length:438 start_codon:yes stop_codon:yes gene_type:complete
MIIKIINRVWIFLFLLIGGCANNDEPEIGELVNNLYQARTVTNYQVSGKRDGATTHVFIIFKLKNNERLQLELEITYNPVPILSSGAWRIDGKESNSGIVKAESLKFLGGQGEGPSVGGRFQLVDNFQPRFRVFIPLRPINKPKW